MRQSHHACVLCQARCGCGSLTAWVQLHALVAENAHVCQGIEKASPWQVAESAPWQQSVLLPAAPNWLLSFF